MDIPHIFLNQSESHGVSRHGLHLFGSYLFEDPIQIFSFSELLSTEYIRENADFPCVSRRTSINRTSSAISD